MILVRFDNKALVVIKLRLH